MSTIDPGARRDAFDTLLPVASDIADALNLVERDVADDRKLNQPVRSSFHPSQRASLTGMTRFSSAVVHVGRALDSRSECRRMSTASQESQNLYMWLVGERLVLRVKHDLEGVVDPGTAQLFAVTPTEPNTTVFLTWSIAPDGCMRNASFATVDEPRWTIPLSQLLAVELAPAELPAYNRRVGPAVRSKRPAAGRDERE